MALQPLDTILLLLIAFCAIATMAVKDLASAVIVFGAFGFFSALLYALLGAVDVALMEATVGAGLTTVFFVVAIRFTELKETP